ncbi:DUF488 domain-containing protein [Melghirimyces profundicolus]|nr:DUF488 family protein [Melghirimyces profundicolus]
MEFRIKRVYEEPEVADGTRVLVDRLWPRGLSKEKARVDLWPKELAPSDELRKRFHEDGDFNTFEKDYRAGIDPEDLDRLLNRLEGERVTLLFASKDEKENNAQVLKKMLMEKSGQQNR